MIINRGPIVEIEGQKYMFDYSACKYPVGVVEDQIYYFNELFSFQTSLKRSFDHTY